MKKQKGQTLSIVASRNGVMSTACAFVAGCAIAFLLFVVASKSPFYPMKSYQIQDMNTAITCDLSHKRYDFCEMQGDIRFLGNQPAVFFACMYNISACGDIRTIQPHPRKDYKDAMKHVKKVTLKPITDTQLLPPCSVIHKVPAILFSAGGYAGNFFHSFTDVVIPLYITSKNYKREVQFLIADTALFKPNKYIHILKQLTNYDIINFDNDDRVHCYRMASVGLIAHKELGIDPNKKSQNGYHSISEFRQLLADAYSLERRYAIQITAGNKKRPRLLLISRSRTRKIMNEKEITEMAANLGYDVIIGRDDASSELQSFSRIVNSCDVIMGVHGAGLTNFLFLPAGAVLIQIVPFGRLEWTANDAFRNPVKDTDIRYLEYNVSQEESSLKDIYSPDDPVLKDPLSIHKRGWPAMSDIYLKQQNVKLELSRFRGVLLDALQILQRQN